MVAYQVGVHTVGVGIVIILLCVTNITSKTHLNNATMYAVCGHLLDNQNCAHSLEMYTPSPHIDRWMSIVWAKEVWDCRAVTGTKNSYLLPVCLSSTTMTDGGDRT